jgi:hypothetical protein
MNALSYELKEVMPLLCQDDRWNVLTVLILFSNVRNRCWPSMDLIAKMGCNGNKARATRAKKWLVEHGAIELVKHSQRHEDEKHLPPRQHVYQLTGVIKVYPSYSEDADMSNLPSVLTYHYLYTQDLKSFDGETFESLPVENFDGETGSNTNTSKTSLKEKDFTPPVGAVTIQCNQCQTQITIPDGWSRQETLDYHGWTDVDGVVLCNECFDPYTDAETEGESLQDETPLYDKPAAPGNISQKQWDGLKPVYALGQVMGIIPVGKDIGMMRSVTNDLRDAGILPEHYADFVAMVKAEAVAGTGWKVTPKSLTANGRMSRFVARGNTPQPKTREQIAKERLAQGLPYAY